MNLVSHSVVLASIDSSILNRLNYFFCAFYVCLGFISGLCTTTLPECYERNVPGPLRPHVQHHYTSPDPFSPLSLVVPRGMAPPWKDCFVEGQRDLLHGGTISSSVVMGVKLKQCSRCVCVCVCVRSVSGGGGGGKR